MPQNTQSKESSNRPRNQARLSVAEKKAIVALVEEGVTQKSLYKQYGISTAAIREWVNKYASDAYLARKQRIHDLQAISPVVRAILEGRLTVKDAAIQHQVHSSTIKGWIKRYEQQQSVMRPVHPAPSAQAGETDTERKLREELGKWPAGRSGPWKL